MSEIKCPRCASLHLHAGHKGFGLGKAVAGGVLLGPVGLLGGVIGSKKVMITCLKCGYKWQAGKEPAANRNNLQAGFKRDVNNAVLSTKEPSTEEKIKILKKHLAEGKITKEQYENIIAEMQGR
jgi:hypothetical protein